jgi:hypothetical protein
MLGVSTRVPLCTRSSPLYSETNPDQSSDPVTQDTPSAPTNAGNDVADILNSPVFLKRKIDVLKSDIAEMDTKISAANALYEANKAEWGEQFDKLQREVRLN